MIDAMIRLRSLSRSLLIMCIFAINSGLHAEVSQADLADKADKLKEQVLELNQELFVLEEDLLFPLDSQIHVFVTIEDDFIFKMNSVKLELDGKVVSNYLYTEKETQVLQRGGVQQIYAGKMITGKHKLMVTFSGKAASFRDYKRISSIPVTKTKKTKFVELKIKASKSDKQPVLLVKVWE